MEFQITENIILKRDIPPGTGWVIAKKGINKQGEIEYRGKHWFGNIENAKRLIVERWGGAFDDFKKLDQFIKRLQDFPLRVS